MELRERRGLAYALHVLSDEGLDPGPFSLYAATAPEAEDEVIALMREEVERVRSNGLRRDELERAKAFLIGGHARAYQRASARASELAYCARYGLPYESEAGFIRRIRAVTGAAVRTAACEFLAPERECIVRLGSALRKREMRSRKKKAKNG
jgi:zinc protease